MTDAIYTVGTTAYNVIGCGLLTVAVALWLAATSAAFDGWPFAAGDTDGNVRGQEGKR